ncbi:riboflavin kinase [Thermophilibacter mediterraneus]|uniref:riboflavin kinase n=1 Tax=Thermophilibacter mediterraneus TaxID=1871031 RepID=UPI000931C69B|nr:riboflavin kinase [Thermophilibacter mediterraneus]
MSRAGAGDLRSALLALAPDRPLGAVGARELVRASLVAVDCTWAARELELLGGAVTGRVFRDASGGATFPLRRAPWGEPLARPRAVCAVGAFDGAHRGHAALLGRARYEADARGAELAVVTFSPDPADVLAPGRPGDALLPPAVRQHAVMELSGADALVVLDFTPELAALPYERFVRGALDALVDLECPRRRARRARAGARLARRRGLHMGRARARAARRRRDRPRLPRRVGAREGFDVIGMELADEGGAPISATRVRSLVRAGRVEDAAGLLGRCHYVSGRVEHGRGEGTGFGFPTANVAVDESLCLPAEGVYAGFVAVGAMAWPAAINVGKPRSFSPGERDAAFLEATLLGFEGSLYGEEVSVVFARWLREPRSFASLEELERTVLGNVGWVRATLGERGVSLLGEGDS